MRGVERRGKEVSASLKIMLSLPITYSFQWISHSIHMCLGWCLDGIEFSLATLVSGAALSLPNIIFSFPFSFLQNSFLLLCHCRIHQSVFAQQYYQSVSCWDYKIYLKKKKKDIVRFVWSSHTIWFMEQCTTEGRPSGRWRWHKGWVRKVQKQQALQTLLPPHSSHWQSTASISALNSNERRCHESLLKDVCKVFWDPYGYNAEKCPWRAEISVLTLQDLLGRK